MFIEERFPSDIALKMLGGPEFSTIITDNISGFEARNINWQTPRSRYNISKTLCTEDDIRLIQNWFRITRGRAFAFRFKDHMDYCSRAELIAISDGKQKDFQLIKNYTIGQHNIIREIKKPVSRSVNIYVDGKATKARVDLSNGIITMESAPVKDTKITADFEFDVPVRFDSDLLQISCAANNLYLVENLELIEILL